VTKEHLGDAVLVDVALGESAANDDAAHLAHCAQCAERVEAARQGWRLASEAELSEPGEVFWRRLRAGIAKSVDEQLRSARRRRGRVRAAWSLAAAATLVLSVAVWSVHRSSVSPSSRVEAAWVPLAATEDDAGFALVSEIVPAVDDEGQSWSGCGACLEELTDAERRDVIDALRNEMGRKS
jgi:hypothetical protein